LVGRSGNEGGSRNVCYVDGYNVKRGLSLNNCVLKRLSFTSANYIEEAAELMSKVIATLAESILLVFIRRLHVRLH
jgi:hypothetical protein